MSLRQKIKKRVRWLGRKCGNKYISGLQMAQNIRYKRRLVWRHMPKEWKFRSFNSDCYVREAA